MLEDVQEIDIGNEAEGEWEYIELNHSGGERGTVRVPVPIPYYGTKLDRPSYAEVTKPVFTT